MGFFSEPFVVTKNSRLDSSDKDFRLDSDSKLKTCEHLWVELNLKGIIQIFL